MQFLIIKNNFMAEILAANNANANRVGKRSQKKSTKVDLTPMVDLGFLLITFFIVTTTLTQKTSMKLDMPHDGKQTNVKNSGALTILLGKNDKVFYYEGELLNNGSNFKVSSFSKIRDVILAKKKSVAAKDMFVIIKPTNGSNYGNVVTILDEMSVNVIRSYALGDITDMENILVEGTEKYASIL